MMRDTDASKPRGAASVMPDASAIVFTRLTGDTLLQRQEDGTFRPVRDQTDRSRLKAG